MPRWMLASNEAGELVPGPDLLGQGYLTRSAAYEAIMSWARGMGIAGDAYGVDHEDGRLVVSIPKGTLTVYPDGLYWRIEAAGSFRKLSARELWLAGRGSYPRADESLLGQIHPTRTQAIRAVIEWANDHGVGDDVSVIGQNGSSRLYILNGWFEIRDHDDGYIIQFHDNVIDTSPLPVLQSM